MNSLFFELIRVSIGTQDTLSRFPTEREWNRLYALAEKQSLLGVCFCALHRLEGDSDFGYESLGMNETQYFTWMGMAAEIEDRNELLNEKTNEALDYFRGKGYPCQVLKGQGIAKLYGNLSLFRQAGDIDIWLSGGRKKIYQLSKNELGSITGANYHHIHFPMWKDPEMEVHIYPSFLSSPYRNWQLHKFCKKYEPSIGCEDTPSLSFNRVFILLHCYRHLCGHGVGLRQVMDYYFVLAKGFTNEEREETLFWCRRLGMGRFVGAMMWVLKSVFAMKDEYLLCAPDEKEGRFLLTEIMATGNMGHGDHRVDRSKLDSAFGRYIYNLRRDLHLLKICPFEALFEPWFNLVLYIRRAIVWKIKYDLK